MDPMTGVGPAARLPYGLPPHGYRLPAATQPGAVHLQVGDLQRSLAYYGGVLGLRTLDSTATSAVFGARGDGPPLVTLTEQRGIGRARRGAFGLYHFALLLPERSALGRFAAHLTAMRVRAASADHSVSEALYLWDPDGLGIEVYADRPRDTWQRRDRELVLTTDPLDVESVIAAGGGEPWTGMPEHTAMGHVHLHVGALADAEAFYHRGLGFDKTVWSYPGALFLSAGGYHHHLGTNVWGAGPAASDGEARLLEWELIVPADGDAHAAGRSLRDAGHSVDAREGAVVATDPWGTRVCIRPAGH